MLPLWAVTVILTPLLYVVYVFCTWAIDFYQHSRELLKLGEPSDRGLLTGHLNNHPGFNSKLPEYFIKQCIQFPRCFCYWLGPIKPTVVVVHPDTIRKISSIASSKFTVGSGGYRLMEPWLGRGLLTTGVQDGRWSRNRKLLTPAFHNDVLKPYMKVYNDSARKLLAQFLGHQGESVDITTPITVCSLEVNMKCALSTNENIQEKGLEHPYVAAVIAFGELVFTRMLRVYLYWDWVYRLTKDGQHFFRLCDFVHNFSSEIINKRRSLLNSSSAPTTKRHLDFLDILLSARDENGEGLTADEIQQEVDTFMFAGYDSTASAISWIMHDLAKHPEHQAACREEVKNLFDGRKNPEFTWDDLNSVPYLTQCIKESMRLHSPVPLISRQLDKPMDFEGIHLRQNTTVDINIYSLHHNPTVWGDDHMEYKPERFLPDNINRMSSYAFIPFSAGPRNCIGQNFAMNEIKVIISSILHSFKFRLDESHKVLHKPSLVMRSETGIKLHFNFLN